MTLPNAALVPYFIFLSALESLAFGLGVALAILGGSNLRNRAGIDKLTVAAFIALVWLLVSWWPHDNMHRVNWIDNFEGLLRIEYTFHFTLIISGFILALYFWKKVLKPVV